MTERRYEFERYKGPSTKFTCPKCAHKRRFTRYVDTRTGERLPDLVGICDRKDNCGYSLTPSQYFRDQGIWRPSEYSEAPPVIERRKDYRMNREDVLATKGKIEENNLFSFLLKHIPEDRLRRVFRDHAVGTYFGVDQPHLYGAAVYWKVSTDLGVRTGKVIQYDPETGHRKKEPGMQNWMHRTKTGKGAAELGVDDCLFGLHLLKSWPMNMPVAIVEAEKTAVIASAMNPGMLWLATGGLSEFKEAKLQVLKGRTVVVFPDLGKGYEEWTAKAHALAHLFERIVVSPLIENIATPEERAEGLDLADYLLRPKGEPEAPEVALVGPDTPPVVLTSIPPPDVTTVANPPAAGERPPMVPTAGELALERLVRINPAITSLVEELDLDVANGTAAKLNKALP